MIRIRYKKSTGQIVGWRSGDRLDSLTKRTSAYDLVDLDIAVPTEPAAALLFDGEKIVANPDYIEPKRVDELADLKSRVEILEAKP